MAEASNEVIIERIGNLKDQVTVGFNDVKETNTSFENRLRAVETFVAGIEKGDGKGVEDQDWVKIILGILGLGSLMLGLLQNFAGKH